MSILCEAISVVISRAAVVRGYPGGLARLAAESPVSTFCADGYLVRAGFYRMEQANYFVEILKAAGLVETARGAAADFVIVDQNLGPATLCLWLEFGRERDGTPVAWHAAARRGSIHAPIGWRTTSGVRVGDVPGRPFANLVRFLRQESGVDWYHDRRSGRLVATPASFIAH